MNNNINKALLAATLAAAAARGTVASADTVSPRSLTPPQGISLNGGVINDGENMANPSGLVFIDIDHEFKIDRQDIKFKACLKIAESLKEQYPLEGLDSNDIVEREKKIVETVTQAIHDQYGDYSPVGAKIDDEEFGIQVKEDAVRAKIGQAGHKNTKALTNQLETLETQYKQLDAAFERTMHDDDNFSYQAAMGVKGVKAPVIGQYGKDTLVCYDFAVLGSALLDAADVPNLLVGGYNKQFDAGANGKLQLASGGGHMFLISKTTGKIIDTTADAADAYEPNVPGISLAGFLAGKTAVVEAGDDSIETYALANGRDDLRLAQADYDKWQKSNAAVVSVLASAHTPTVVPAPHVAKPAATITEVSTHVTKPAVTVTEVSAHKTGPAPVIAVATVSPQPFTPPRGTAYFDGFVEDGKDMANPSGMVFWAKDRELNLDRQQDPRFQFCLETATSLRAQYPLDGLDLRDKTAIQKTIVDRLAKAVFSQYGGYNQAYEGYIQEEYSNQQRESAIKAEIAQGDGNPILSTQLTALTARDKQLGVLSKEVMHNDDQRSYDAARGVKGAVAPSLGEFRDGLTCRLDAPLASALLEAAGVDNAGIACTSSIFAPDASGALRLLIKGRHAAVILKDTGDIVDLTDPAGVYKTNIAGVSLGNLTTGMTVVAMGADGTVQTYALKSGNDDFTLALAQTCFDKQRSAAHAYPSYATVAAPYSSPYGDNAQPHVHYSNTPGTYANTLSTGMHAAPGYPYTAPGNQGQNAASPAYANPASGASYGAPGSQGQNAAAPAYYGAPENQGQNYGPVYPAPAPYGYNAPFPPQSAGQGYVVPLPPGVTLNEIPPEFVPRPVFSGRQENREERHFRDEGRTGRG